MKLLVVFLLASTFALMTPPASAQHKQTNRPPEKAAVSAHLDVAPDLAQKLARFKSVQMPFHSAGLTAREKKLVDKLVDATWKIFIGGKAIRKD